jgi:hypothetical protein
MVAAEAGAAAMNEASDLVAMPHAARLREARRKQQLNCTELPRFPDEAVADDFFGPVLEYLQTMTDAPKEFLFVSMFMTASAVIGNRVSMQIGGQKVKPNLYGLCLAGSTVGRKTTAVSFCTRYLRMTEVALQEEEVRFRMPDSGSHEGLMESMREPRQLRKVEGKGAKRIETEEMEVKEVMNSGIACYSEFASFLDNLRKDYNKGMESFILDVYDGNSHTRQLKSEQSCIVNPCLSIFGASTLTQFLQRITENDKHSGFLQRIFYCYVADKRGKLRSLIENHTPDERMEELITSSLEKIFRIACLIEQHGITIKLSAEACKVYQRSFDDEQEELEEIGRSDGEFSGVLMGYQGRLDMMKFKVAMVYLVVETAGRSADVTGLQELLITDEMMGRAVALIGYFWKTVGNLLMHQFKFTPHEQKMKRVVDILTHQNGSMRRRDLLHSAGWKAKEFDEVINTGIESGVLALQDEKQGSGQVTKMIKLMQY